MFFPAILQALLLVMSYLEFLTRYCRFYRYYRVGPKLLWAFVGVNTDDPRPETNNLRFDSEKNFHFDHIPILSSKQIYFTEIKYVFATHLVLNPCKMY